VESERDRARRAVLAGFGAAPEAIDEVLQYTQSPFDAARLDGLDLPLSDEPHLDAWTEYVADARRDGTIAALARRLVQLQFPVAAGISQSDEYRAATRRGVAPTLASRPRFEDPDGVILTLHETAAGRVPIVIARDRRDFVTLVQACSCRNEPEAVPDSMGACIVAGLNNWDRIARYRRRLEDERGGPVADGEWADAFRALVPRKELYQDRFIILGRAPYSAVPATDVGLDDAAWLERSLAIRLEHECAHYFTLRTFGVMRNHLLDEFIADFAGLAYAFGRYDAGLFLRFLGLEAYPAIRRGGRFALYLGTPPLAPHAAHVVAGLVVAGARHVESFTRGLDLADASIRARLVVALAGLTLEELAGADAAGLLAARAERRRPS
jgi:hypothetical protein